jgi:hypothetical protein
MTRVVLHIGAPKTGTTFVQSVLQRNRELLAERGVLFPGRTWSDQVRAVKDLFDAANDKIRNPRRWDSLTHEISEFEGHTAIISMEWLGSGTLAMARLAVKSLADHDVHVVLTLRDLARVIPAQWQETMQNGFVWTYSEFLNGVTAQEPEATPAGAQFLRHQDWGRILQTWGAVVPSDRMWVVTVPPPGSQADLLWVRFCEATGIEPAGYSLDVRRNDSLGAVSAELMRRVSVARRATGGKARHREVLKHKLAKGILSGRRPEEPSLVLPPELYQWVRRVSQEQIGRIVKAAPHIVGELDDLRPHMGPLEPGSISDLDRLPTEALLDAAIHGLVELTRPAQNEVRKPIDRNIFSAA